MSAAKQTNCLEPLGSTRPPKGLVYAKVGTQPAGIIFDRRCRFYVGNLVRFKRPEVGERNFRYVRWQTGIIDHIDPIRITLM